MISQFSAQSTYQGVDCTVESPGVPAARQIKNLLLVQMVGTFVLIQHLHMVLVFKVCLVLMKVGQYQKVDLMYN